MARIVFLPDGRDAPAEPGRSLLEAALAAGVPLEHACGGRGRCSTCRVLVAAGAAGCEARTEGEVALAARLAFPPDVRLACQVTVCGGADVTVRRLVLDAEDRELAAADLGTPGSAGHEERPAILFSDIRGFTAFAESVPAYDVIHLLNRWYREAGSAAGRRRGRLDNIMGDGLMALFDNSAPGGAAAAAVDCGRELLALAGRMDRYTRPLYGRAFRIGVGVHIGEVVVGAIGSGAGARTTAIGDAVNFAARVEAANKAAGTRMLISDAVRAELGPAVADGSVRLGRTVTLAVPGKTGEHALHEVIGPEVAP